MVTSEQDIPNHVQHNKTLDPGLALGPQNCIYTSKNLETGQACSTPTSVEIASPTT